MIPFPSDFATASQRLSDDSLGEAAIRNARQLAGQGYEVHTGLTPEFADKISVMAREPSIREYCPKDSEERFTDQASAGRWLSKNRGMFLLLKHADDGALDLAGYGWSGYASNQQVPGGETTFAIRIGEAGQGHGLATPFAWLIVAASAALYGAKNLWLETWLSNGGAVHVYHKIGFVTVTEKPDGRSLPDGGTAPDKRVYMSLPNKLLPLPPA